MDTLCKFLVGFITSDLKFVLLVIHTDKGTVSMR